VVDISCSTVIGRQAELGALEEYLTEARGGRGGLVTLGHDAWVVGDETCVIIDFIPTPSA
jgi:hypothetical protein